MIHATSKIDFPTRKQAARSHAAFTRETPRSTQEKVGILAGIGLILFVLSKVSPETFGISENAWSLILAIGGIFWIVAVFSSRRAFRALPHYGRDVRWEIADDRFTMSVGGDVHTLQFANLLRAVVTPSGILLYEDEDRYHWLPTEGMEINARGSIVEALERHAREGYVMKRGWRGLGIASRWQTAIIPDKSPTS